MNIFEEYEGLEVELKAKEERKQELRKRILIEMQVLGEKNHDGSQGTFVVTEKKSWIYTPKIKDLEEKVKEAKHKEENNGKAKPGPITTYITYSKKKAKKQDE